MSSILHLVNVFAPHVTGGCCCSHLQAHEGGSATWPPVRQPAGNGRRLSGGW